MNYLSLDLEMAQPSGKIIQIGACIGNIITGEILEQKSWFVSINEDLSPFITTLTGITDYDLQTWGWTLVEASQELFCMAKQYDCMVNPITWGGGDSKELKDQLQIEYDKTIIGKVFDWPFGRRWVDVKTVFQFRQLARGEKIQAGLAKALTKCGMSFKGRKHNALDDATNTFLLAHHLLKEMKP